MLTSERERKPIWTAFVTKQLRVPGWASRDSQKVVLLADLEQFIFTNDYSPQTILTDKFELTFITSSGTALVNPVVLVYMLIGSDAEEFIANIQALRKDTQKVDVKQKT